MAKCIVPHLKPNMNAAISDNQSAFLEERQILENVMVGFEGLHTMMRVRLGNGFFGALKLDMSKAYDRVEWDFIESTMLALRYER